MSKKPWLKFYPRDFLGNPNLARLDRATRMVLLEVICLAHEQPTYGRIDAGTLAGYLAGDEQAASAVAILITNGVLRRDHDGTGLVLRRLVRDHARSQEGALARLKRVDLAGLPRACARVPEARSQKPESLTPPPPSGAKVHEPKPAKRHSPEPWQSVLERHDYEALRSSPEFLNAWDDWIEHCRETGSKAREPSGIQAAKILNEAARHSPAQFRAAVDASIAANWQGIHYPNNGSTPSQPHRQTSFDVLQQGATLLQNLRESTNT